MPILNISSPEGYLLINFWGYLAWDIIYGDRIELLDRIQMGLWLWHLILISDFWTNGFVNAFLWVSEKDEVNAYLTFGFIWFKSCPFILLTWNSATDYPTFYFKYTYLYFSTKLLKSSVSQRVFEVTLCKLVSLNYERRRRIKPQSLLLRI